MALTSVLDRTVSAEEAIPCRREPELWFAESPTDVETAKALCHECPIQARCYAGALDRAEPWGVWGGELFVSGMVVARKRPRGRPRKNAVVPGPLERRNV